MSEALKEKLALLSAAGPRLVRSVTERTDELLRRVEATELRSVKVFAQQHANLDAIEAGVGMVDDALNQLSNGGPPLDGSTKPSGG
jgi:hypothetical protein